MFQLAFVVRFIKIYLGPSEPTLQPPDWLSVNDDCNGQSHVEPVMPKLAS